MTHAESEIEYRRFLCL